MKYIHNYKMFERNLLIPRNERQLQMVKCRRKKGETTSDGL